MLADIQQKRPATMRSHRDVVTPPQHTNAWVHRASLRCASLLSTFLFSSACSVVDLPQRLSDLEREHALIAGSIEDLRADLTTLRSDADDLASRQDEVEEWIERLGGASRRNGPSPTARMEGRPPKPAVESRQLLRGGLDTVIFDNSTDRTVTVRTARGPAAASDVVLDLRVLPAVSSPPAGSTSADGALDARTVAAPGEYAVPCGARLVASATADMLLFVDAENGEPCSPERSRG